MNIFHFVFTLMLILTCASARTHTRGSPRAAQEPSADMLSPFLQYGVTYVNIHPLSPERGFLELFLYFGEFSKSKRPCSPHLGSSWVSHRSLRTTFMKLHFNILFLLSGDRGNLCLPWWYESNSGQAHCII